MDEKLKSALVQTAVRDFEEVAKRTFRDASRPLSVTIGPPNWHDEALGVFQGQMEIHG